MKQNWPNWLPRLNPARSPQRSQPSTVKPSAVKPSVAALATAVGLASALPGCLERPLGQDGPRTTNIIVDLLPQNVVSKVDMLFVIDNSMSMADKQAILAEAVPDLVSRFVKPVCLNGENQEAPYEANGECPNGFGPEFTPIKDIHIGVVTSSLGGFGSQNDCVPDERFPYYVQKYDMAHLIGSLERGTGNGGDFLTWNDGDNAALTALTTNFANQVKAAGEQGCGWEATMEAWVHFLVDPAPFTDIVRQNCNASDTKQSCAGPVKDANGAVLPDNTVLEQRRNFLRMDSLLAVIMLTDENDCSFKLSGQQWLASDTYAAPNTGTFRGSEQCASDPNDTCCQSCGGVVKDGCPSITVQVNGQAQQVAAGCDPQTYPLAYQGTAANSEDQGNLRCFKQKQRFGTDFLLPVQRYSNALNELQICPNSETLTGCSNPVPNPVFIRDGATRPKTLVFFGGIVGVPWQNLAVDPGADVLKYRKAKSDVADEVIDWNLLLGAPINDMGERRLYPTNDGTIDPHMYEAVEPRDRIPGPNAGYMEDPINGHDWNILDRTDLQYACIFPKPTTNCPTQAEVQEMGINNPEQPIANCDCTYYGPGNSEDGEYNSPLCQQPNGDYGLAQSFGKAYPGVRELQALELFAKANPSQNAIVASICPKESDAADRNKADWGYRPAVATIVDRLKEQLQEPCLPRPLATKEDGGAACIIIEATTDEAGCMLGDANARSAVDPNIAPLVYQALETKELCEGAQCNSYKLCEVPQIRPVDDGYRSCIAGGSGANGWCYLDGENIPDGLEDDPAVDAALNKCPVTSRRKLRFAGKGKAQTASSLTFFACSGSVYDVEM